MPSFILIQSLKFEKLVVIEKTFSAFTLIILTGNSSFLFFYFSYFLRAIDVSEACFSFTLRFSTFLHFLLLGFNLNYLFFGYYILNFAKNYTVI